MRAKSTKQPTVRHAILSFFAAVVLSATPAQAEFRGGGIIHSYEGCAALGWPDGVVETVRARYGPSEVYGETSTISLFYSGGGAVHLFANADLEQGRTRYGGRGWGVFRTLWRWEERIRVRSLLRRVVAPPIARRDQNFDAATVIDMQLRIINFAGTSGCTAVADLTLRRRN
jgi:hypothetical protein